MAGKDDPLGRPENRSVVARLLGVFAEVRSDEVATVVLLTINVALLLLAYYLLKTVREPLILASGGAEVKSYAAGGQAVLLVGVVYGYGTLTRRYGRMRLVTVTTLIFVANLVAFFILGRLHVPIGVPFFLWVGCFSLTAIAQFWSFATDLYTPEQGKRLFAIVGAGSSLGALAGAAVARVVFVPIGPYWMMLLAAGLLLVCLAILSAVNRIETGRGSQASKKESEAPIGGAGGFALLARDRYLMLIAVLGLVVNAVNTTGEYIVDVTLVEGARRQVLEGSAHGLTVEQIIGIFKASYFGWVNIVGVVLQCFAVSRIFKYLGVRAALLVLPAVALGGYATIAMIPMLAAVKVAKIAENSVDYSVQATARQALYLPVSRDAKFAAKAAIDTFVVRIGDVFSAGLVWVGVHLAFRVTHFALVNIALVGVWMGIAWAVGRRFQSETARVEAAGAPAEGASPREPGKVVAAATP